MDKICEHDRKAIEKLKWFKVELKRQQEENRRKEKKQ